MKKKHIILFRQDETTAEEFRVCCDVFGSDYVHEYRSTIPHNSVVIPRYSALPFYRELKYDCETYDSSLINSYEQHKWIADFWGWYGLLHAFTFKSWDDNSINTAPHDGTFVVKGATNSKKHQWNTKMFASNRQQALNIGAELFNDSLIQNQKIVYRQYVPLETFEIGINGVRFTNEWRFFVLYDKIICNGYYWSIANRIPAKYPPGLIGFTNDIVSEISGCPEKPNFYVLDVAKGENGKLYLVEVNDGSMSGLGCCNPTELYVNLRKTL